MKWKDKLIKDVLESIRKSNRKLVVIENLLLDNNVNVHLAVFNEPFLSLMFSGEKTVESRFSINNVAPYRSVFFNDLVLLKKSGGPIVGAFNVKDVKYYSNLNSKKISKLESEYGEKIGWNREPDFLDNKSTANYLTLITVNKVFRLSPIVTEKADRTGWSIVRKGFINTLFEN